MTDLVRPGVWSIALPMPIASPALVLVYVIEDAAGALHLIDAGWNTDDSWRALETGLAEIGHLIADVATVTATHQHNDHLGMASRIRAASGARIALHPADQAALDADVPLLTAADLERWGVPDGLAGDLAILGASRARAPQTADLLVEHGDLLPVPGREVRVIHTPGHTPGHIALALDDLVFTGDLVLPDIFPGVGLGGGNSDALGDYLASLDRVEQLGASEACPGHGYTFTSVAARCAETRAHQLSRTREVAAILDRDPSATVWQVASEVQWADGWDGLSGMRLASALAQTALRMRHLQASSS